MHRFLLLALLTALPAAADEPALEALELDVVDRGERPDKAIERMGQRSHGDDLSGPTEGRLLRLDWRLDSLAEHQATSGPLAAPEPEPILAPIEERGHGHAFGHDRDGRGHDGGGRGHDGHDRDGDRDGDRGHRAGKRR